MSMGLRLAIGLGLVTLLAGAGVLGYWALQTREQSLPPLPVDNVPASWREFRDAPGHATHVGSHGIECTKCHDLALGFSKPEPRVCVGCHEQEGRMQHGLHAAHDDVFAGVANCVSCHNFGPTHTDQLWACERCHDQPQHELAAVVVHADEACGKCHHPHVQPSIEPMACVTCHAGAANTHAGKASSNPENCLSCHQAHGHATLADERCVSCHEDKPHALFAGHDRCAGCHAPHAFQPKEVKPCRSCHESQHVLAESQVDAHRACTSCHDPHAVAHPGDATCKKCHTNVAPTHPVVGSHTCLSCHKPHPTSTNAPLALACTECHTAIAGDDKSAHGGRAACLNCHKPHAFAQPAQAAACTECHAVQLAAIAKNPGHQRCLECHHGSPHVAELSQLGPVACASCHKDVHPRKEHLECTRCHEPHSGTPRALVDSCGSCHKQQEKSTVEAHRACLTCHTPHEGGKLTAATCVGCHTTQTKQNHGEIAGGCTQCHGIHADKGVRATPACTSCHTPAKLPGLHAVEQHQECNKCHVDAHNTGPWSARATCINCHQEQKNHVPEAQLCQGCHVFRK
jgi:hypothetical protein